MTGATSLILAVGNRYYRAPRCSRLAAEARSSKKREPWRPESTFGPSTLRLAGRGCLTKHLGQKEFGKLKDDETIYKLIGPVLLEQDKTEAESTVNGRIEFIGKEM